MMELLSHSRCTKRCGNFDPGEKGGMGLGLFAENVIRAHKISDAFLISRLAI